MHWADHDDRATSARRKAKLARNRLVRAFWLAREAVHMKRAGEEYVLELTGERPGWVAPVPVREVDRDG